jgi:pimeloyl-ACP methyl ester carboxylesterase
MTPPDTSVLYKSADGYRRATEAYDALLAELTIPYETRWVETRHGLTHVIAAGTVSAPAIALWHGLDASAPTWVNQINAAARVYRVYAVDVVGSMGKSSPARLDREGGAYGQWMADVLYGLKVEQAHQIGISNGGWLILKLAGVAPELIASAVLMSSAGFVRSRWQLIFKMLPVLLFTPRAQRGARFLQAMGAPGIPPAKQDVVMFDILMRDFHYERAPGPLPDAAVGRLTAPTDVLMGEYEAAFSSKAVIERAEAVLPNLKKAEILSGVGHGMITEDPHAVNERLLTFVAAQVLAGSQLATPR